MPTKKNGPTAKIRWARKSPSSAAAILPLMQRVSRFALDLKLLFCIVA